MTSPTEDLMPDDSHKPRGDSDDLVGRANVMAMIVGCKEGWARDHGPAAELIRTHECQEARDCLMEAKRLVDLLGHRHQFDTGGRIGVENLAVQDIF